MSSTRPTMQPGQCDICFKVVSRVSDLPRHKILHAESGVGKKFTCPSKGCGYETSIRSNLNTHMTTHSDAKLHCPDCDKTLKNASSLLVHRKTQHGYEANTHKDEVELFLIWSCS
ncbi:hypothetical protein CPC08DRAFT_803658 [Agrocybe pediades]|nr:hypothetical protein CPC08DRAFT_803658 [Agrocybe pediades]